MRVKARRSLTFDACDDVEMFPKCRHKEFVTIRDYVQGKSVLAVPIIEEEGCEVFGREFGGCGNDSNVGTKAISYGKDAIKSLINRKRTYEVHGDRFAAIIRDRKRV